MCCRNVQSSPEAHSNISEISNLSMCDSTPQLDICALRWTGSVHGARLKNGVWSYTVSFAIIPDKLYWFRSLRSQF